jgi:hypothetical protein
LLTEGYLQGWLTFKYNNPLSLAREEFIINQVEERKFAEARKMRVMLDVQVGAAARSPQLLQAAFDSFEDYLGLTLPYLFKQAKLDTESSKQQLSDIKAFLQKKKKELAASKPAVQP